MLSEPYRAPPTRLDLGVSVYPAEISRKRGQILLGLEAFGKKTQKTPPESMALAERRLRDWRARGRAGNS